MSAPHLHSDRPNTVIIGAGLGGLTLARILKLKGLPCQIFDGDAGPSARPQGGSLDLKPESGQRALIAAKLFKEWQQLARSEGEDLKIMDKFGKVYHEEVSNGESFHPEIDRGQLRDILLNGLDANAVKWGHKLVLLDVQEDGLIRCQFAGGNVMMATLVIGADGAWSKVRATLSTQRPIYTGLSFVDLTISGIASKPATIQKLIGQGMLFALSDKKGLITQCNSDGTARTYAAIFVPENWCDELPAAIPVPQNQISHLIDKYYSDWHADLQQLILRADYDKIFFRPIHALPSGFQWSPVTGITLLGDAAHVMSPFAGEGANLAMADAADLAEALTTRASVNDAIRQYEQIAWKRASEASAESAANLSIFFGDNGAQAAAAIFQGHHGPPE